MNNTSVKVNTSWELLEALDAGRSVSASAGLKRNPLISGLQEAPSDALNSLLRLRAEQKVDDLSLYPTIPGLEAIRRNILEQESSPDGAVVVRNKLGSSDDIFKGYAAAVIQHILEEEERNGPGSRVLVLDSGEDGGPVVDRGFVERDLVLNFSLEDAFLHLPHLREGLIYFSNHSLNEYIRENEVPRVDVSEYNINQAVASFTVQHVAGMPLPSTGQRWEDIPDTVLEALFAVLAKCEWAFRYSPEEIRRCYTRLTAGLLFRAGHTLESMEVPLAGYQAIPDGQLVNPMIYVAAYA